MRRAGEGGGGEGKGQGEVGEDRKKSQGHGRIQAGRKEEEGTVVLSPPRFQSVAQIFQYCPTCNINTSTRTPVGV